MHGQLGFGAERGQGGDDFSEAALVKAREDGVLPHTSASAAAEGADVLVTMLPTTTAVASTIRGLVDQLNEVPAVFIDCSTIGASEARAHAAVLHAAGATFLDAPVSGGHPGAVSGSLTIMVGGAKTAFDAMRPVPSAMGSNVTYCGEVGNGQGVKICNNLVLGIHEIALAEAFLMGERIGLDATTIFEVMSNSTGNSWALQNHCPVPVSGRHFPVDDDCESGGAAEALFAKDLGLAKDAMLDVGMHSVIGIPAAELFAEFYESGRGHLDMSAIILALREKG